VVVETIWKNLWNMRPAPPSNSPQQTATAMRREFYVALIAFVVGFIVVLASLSWLIVRFIMP
jgi:hypothetical protein